jgi:fatty-acyl-CoA synthase
MVMGVLGCVTHGTAMIFPGEAFDPDDVLRAVARERCTALYAVPTMFIAMLESPDFATHDLSSLRTGVMAGSICPADVMARVIDDMHMRDVTICYGMTETSPVSMQTKADDPVAKRVSTVGQIHPFVEVKIIDDQGRVVARGQQGEFLTRGYSVMTGYWGDAARTKASIDATGWMHTGDLAVMDDDGYVDITGRLKDMIIRGGENIYPREVEEFLYTHPAIRDVQVFGVPDDKFGEEVCAWIQLKDGEEAQDADIAAFCKGQIAHFKIPRHIRFVDAFPMTVTGKIQKFEMRKQMDKDRGIR